MDKRYRVLMLFVLILSISINDCQVVYGAEDLYNICNSYDVQDALLIGKIVGINLEKETMKVEVIRLVSGKLKYKDNKIKIQCDNLEKLNAGDEVLLSLNSIDQEENLYEIAYEEAFYSVQCMENKKIRILKNISYDYDYNDFNYFDIILQWFCNTGEILTEEDLLNTTKYYRWEGEKKQLVYDQNKDIYYQDSFSSEFNAPDVIRENEKRAENIRAEALMLFGPIAMGGAALLYFGARKRKNNTTLTKENQN